MIAATKVDKLMEKRILSGMIVSDRFLGGVVPIFRLSYMTSRAARVVAKWCIDYWEQYGKAPKQHIEDIYHSSLRSGELDESMEEFVELLLDGLSDEFVEESIEASFNAEYLLDQAEQFFKRASLNILVEDMRKHLSKGSILDAEVELSKYSRVQRLLSPGIDPFTDADSIREAFEYSTTPLFKLPGRIGKMLNSQWTRDSFVSFLAPEKRGKSFWLQELALRAYRSRCNVVMFETGDLSKSQRIRRIHSYISKAHFRGKEDREVLYPVLDCIKNQSNRCSRAERSCGLGIEVPSQWESARHLTEIYQAEARRGYSPCCSCKDEKGFRGAVWYDMRQSKGLEWTEALKNSRRWTETMKGKRFKLSVHDNNSLNVSDIRSQLDIWEQVEGFVPDVIVIDYADIMAPESRKDEYRHQENERWKALRALSQNRHCCVITATQADAASYGKRKLALSNFSEDKRKYAHVTAMYALDQTEHEKKSMLMRIGELVVRDKNFDTIDEVTVMQCLEIGRALVGSF